MDGPPRAEPGASDAASTSAASAAAAPLSLIDSVGALLRELPGLVSDRVELLSLELKHAGRALAQIVMLIVAAAILGVTAWLAVWGMVVALLVTEAGLHWALALLLAMAANVVVVAWALARARKLAPLLGLPATQRHLTLRSPAQPAPPSKPPEPSPTLAGTHA